MYACIYYHPPSCICTLCQLSSTASAMHQSLHMLVLYIFTCWMLQDLCTHLSSFPRWRLLLLNISLYQDWSYVELVYLMNLWLVYTVRDVLQLSSDQIFAWTDSTIVLSLLRRNPRWFKTYMANCGSQVFEILPPDCWRHVDSSQNRWTVHPQVCTHLNFIIILYGGKDLIGWS